MSHSSSSGPELSSPELTFVSGAGRCVNFLSADIAGAIVLEGLLEELQCQAQVDGGEVLAWG
jgi:hypothetical protein